LHNGAKSPSCKKETPGKIHLEKTLLNREFRQKDNKQGTG
jgi:hypothetical protein